MKKIALVTGATSGIGKATALLLSQNGFRVIITGRRKNRLDELCQQIPDCLALNFDIRQQKEVAEALSNLPEEWQTIDLLVNNAGLAAGLEPLHDNQLNDWEQMIDTNIKGLLYVTKIISRQMVERQQGQIINVSSIAGKEAYGKGAVYCATKHAVEALTKAMRIDFNPYGIKVGSVSPGAVETEFSIVRLKDKNANKKVYAGYEPLKAEDIADAILYMATRPAHVNIADILILPTAQANATVFNKK
ncbi:MAG TPA: SDR family NAD(P)-dependent oxidoreductase [Flavobacteriales bacterium]|nr:SDR family NAD(P)-dependent oxidoreductase [Flavobacteriales bacterium]